MDIICIDADDFYEFNNKLWLFDQLHRYNGMVFTLFTIPGLCTRKFIDEVKEIPYIDMVPHGWMHPHSRECEKWSYEDSIVYLDHIESLGLTKGFKAPGWQISDGTYRALLERGYWVADQHYNTLRRPPELKVHFPGYGKHFHVGHMGGYNENEIEMHLPALKQMTGFFRFIKDVI